jgi:HAD superfamily hydrolase (TIGR01549 family)
VTIASPLPRPAAVFLDFDGVIMDSMALKLESYLHALSPWTKDREAVRALQLASAGLSRFKVIPYMFQGLLGRPMPEESYREALERFTEHDEASRARMELKPGTARFLAAAKAAGIPLAIVTGTPQEAIDRTIAHFGLGPFFREVRGSPGLKKEHLLDLLATWKLEASRCYYVGDAVMDQEAAAAARIPFIGVDNGDHPFAPGGLVAEVANLDPLPELLGFPPAA